MTKDEMKSALHSAIRIVVFTKTTGEVRTMNCTLSEAFIPEDKRPKGGVITGENENLLRVFDVDKKDWRSFKLDSVMKFI